MYSFFFPALFLGWHFNFVIFLSWRAVKIDIWAAVMLRAVMESSHLSLGGGDSSPPQPLTSTHTPWNVQVWIYIVCILYEWWCFLWWQEGRGKKVMGLNKDKWRKVTRKHHFRKLSHIYRNFGNQFSKICLHLGMSPRVKDSTSTFVQLDPDIFCFRSSDVRGYRNCLAGTLSSIWAMEN